MTVTGNGAVTRNRNTVMRVKAGVNTVMVTIVVSMNDK